MCTYRCAKPPKETPPHYNTITPALNYLTNLSHPAPTTTMTLSTKVHEMEKLNRNKPKNNNIRSHLLSRLSSCPSVPSVSWEFIGVFGVGNLCNEPCYCSWDGGKNLSSRLQTRMRVQGLLHHGCHS